jgi:hypothetical protein
MNNFQIVSTVIDVCILVMTGYLFLTSDGE